MARDSESHNSQAKAVAAGQGQPRSPTMALQWPGTASSPESRLVVTVRRTAPRLTSCSRGGAPTFSAQ